MGLTMAGSSYKIPFVMPQSAERFKGLPLGKDGNLYTAVITLQDIFNHPTFPRNFTPPDYWADTIEVQTPEVFDDGLIESIKRDKHPFAWEGLLRHNPNIEDLLREQVKSVRSRVTFEDPSTQHIVLRGSSEFLQFSSSALVTILAQQCGHLAAPIIEDRISQDEIENIKESIQEVEQSGYRCELSELRLRRQGCTQFITLERRRLLMLSNFGKYYGNFFDDLYGDIYRSFVLIQLFILRSGASFDEGVFLFERFMSARSSDDAAYYCKLAEYTNQVDWTKLISAGVSSDVNSFLKAGTDIFGEKEHKNILDELQLFRNKIAISDSL